MSNADEHREPESLELNKETLQDLDVESKVAEVKGGALEVGYTPPTLGGFTPPTLKQMTYGCVTAACVGGVIPR